MSVFHDNALIGASGQAGYQIERSLRFNSADSAYLNRTPASAGNRKTWTWSGWVKRSKLASGALFQSFGPGGFGIDGSLHFSGDTLDLIFDYNGGSRWRLTTTQVFRDPSAWYHLVVVVDTTNATAGDRLRFYANGIRITDFSTANYPSLNADGTLNQAYQHNIGYSSSVDYFSGYLTEINFIDGQALTPSSFGETDTITGVWKPKRYAGTYGTNGFYLKFADNSGTTSTTLGKDSSGNGNNWTPNNFSVTAGAGNDSLIDTPTPYADGGNGRGNYCTLNPLDVGSTSIALSNGNLDFTKSGANFSPSRGTLGVTTGKWYFEMTVNNSNLTQVGVSNDFNIRASGGNTSVSSTGGIGAAWDSRGFLYQTGSSGPGYGYTFTTNNVVMIAFDVASGKIWFGKNGTWNTGDPAAGTSPAFTASGYSALFPFVNGESGGGGTCNFGQRSFSYTPPSGFLALNTQNLPEPSIKKPSSYMDVKLWTGTGASNTISGFGFSPDLVWIKRRSGTAISHALLDTVRGANKVIYSNLTAAEDTYTDNLTAFNSDGFTLGTDNSWGGVNASTHTYVAWCWDESATPGFDIVTWTGDGAASRNISHSLGVAPKMIISKTRTIAGGDAGYWDVYHASLAAQNTLFLHTTGAATSAPTVWPSAPTSTVFTVGNGSGVNVSGSTYVAYLWSEVAGFSKFGSYTGNGSSDGPFVFCGFQPKFLLVKSSSSGYDWFIFDDARNTYNAVDLALFPNVSGAESGPNTYSFDFLSNGFKLRNTQLNLNGSGNTYIFAAFAESPQKYSLAR